MANHELSPSESAHEAFLPVSRAPESISEQGHSADTLPVSPRDVVLSFYFSQGDGWLQRSIFRWIHARDPALRLTFEQQGELLQFCRRPVHANLHNPNLHVQGNILGFEDSELEAQIGLLSMILNDVPESKPPEAYIADVAGDVIERDWEYRYGRTRQTQPQGKPYNPHTDPHLSHICYYALADQPTGSPLYDEMFDGVRAYVLSMEDDDPLQQDLREVIQRYKHHHPGVQLPQER